jgi:hypothetical protein
LQCGQRGEVKADVGSEGAINAGDTGE